jgi:transposase
MLVFYEANGELMDREALARWVGLSEISIRRHCTPVRYDEETGRALYDVTQASKALGGVRHRVRPARR